MKKFFLLFTLLVLAGLSINGYAGYGLNLFNNFRSFEPEAKAASGAIFTDDGTGRKFHCSGTEIGKTSDGDGIFLTARHCVANPETYKINTNITVSFSADQGGPFYDAQPIALSLTDDLALLVLRDGADIPAVRIRDERRLFGGDPIFNVSFPLGTGKETFHGEFMAARFPTMPAQAVQSYPVWTYSMPINLTIAHGSSGSGIFNQKQRALIGVAVGTFGEGNYNIAIPSDRVIDFLNDLRDNTVTKFVAAFPEQPDSHF